MNRYATFKARSRTFQDLGWEAPSPSLSAIKMAQAGFYCITSDCVKCAYCAKELEGWEAGDDAYEEHKQHEPNCPFVTMYAAPPTKMTVMEALTLAIGVLRFQSNAEFRKLMQQLEDI